MGSAYLSHHERPMKLKIEIDESEAEEIMELARDLTDVVEALRKQVKELKRLCDEQKNLS